MPGEVKVDMLREIALEISKDCNLKCALCPRNRELNETSFLSPEDFSRLLNGTDHLSQICLIGRGEALLNPHLPDILRLGKDRGIKYRLTTNGTLVSKEMARSWKELGLNKVDVSFDTLSQNLMDKLRPGASVERIKESIRYLIEAGIDTKVNFLLCRGNQDKCGAMAEFCKEVGVSKIKPITPLYNRPLEDHPIYGRLTDPLGLDGLGIRIGGYYPTPTFRKHHCNKVAFVGVNGDVYTCLYPLLQGDGKESFEEYYYGQVTKCSADKFYMGNALSMSLDDIWNSPPYVASRANFLKTERQEGEQISIKELQRLRRNSGGHRFAYCENCLARWWQACEA